MHRDQFVFCCMAEQISLLLAAHMITTCPGRLAGTMSNSTLRKEESQAEQADGCNDPVKDKEKHHRWRGVKWSEHINSTEWGICAVFCNKTKNLCLIEQSDIVHLDVTLCLTLYIVNCDIFKLGAAPIVDKIYILSLNKAFLKKPNKYPLRFPSEGILFFSIMNSVKKSWVSHGTKSD